ncbi:MAG: cation:proton antiporter [Deltaproteobacteria bacterium]|nr:cation:proton antiporter [Deltaproteobacteria bacterium]
MPVLSGRFRVPSAILLILFGFATGPHIVGFIHDDTIVAFLSEIGFILLMFLAGLEIDFRDMRRRGPIQLLLIAGISGAIFGLAFLCAHLLGLRPIFGLALGATSVGLPLAILAETRQLRTPLGQTLVLAGSIGEFLTVLGITIFYFSTRYGLSLALIVGVSKLLAVLLCAAVVLRTLTAVAWWWPERLVRIGREQSTSEIGVRAALFLMMMLSMMALIAGIEAIVGAFIAGAFISFSFRGKRAVEEKLAVMGHGLFIPIFFIVVGLRFDPSTISASSLKLAGVLLAAALVVKLIPGLGLIATGLRFRNAAGASVLLSAPLTLVVAIASIGLDLSRDNPERVVLDKNGAGALIILAVAAGIVFPVLFRLLCPRPSSQDSNDR